MSLKVIFTLLYIIQHSTCKKNVRSYEEDGGYIHIIGGQMNRGPMTCDFINEPISTTPRPCGSIENPCKARGYFAKSQDCNEACFYRLNVTFRDIFDDEGSVFVMANKFVKIHSSYEDGPMMRDIIGDDGSLRAISMIIEPQLFANCVILCIVSDNQGNQVRYCFSSIELCKTQNPLPQDFPNIPSTMDRDLFVVAETNPTNFDACDPVDHNTYSCPPLLKYIGKRGVRAYPYKTSACVNTVEFIRFKDGDMSTVCEDRVYGSEYDCGNSAHSRCHSLVQRSAFNLACPMSNTAPHTGIVNMTLGNMPGKGTAEIIIYIQNFDDINTGKLHPSLQINQKALSWFMEDKGMCLNLANMKSYYFPDDSDCDIGFVYVDNNEAREALVAANENVLLDIRSLDVE